MKRWFSIFKDSTKQLFITLLVLFLAGFTSCDQIEGNKNETIQRTIDPKDTVKLAYAENFEIIKFADYTAITIKGSSNSWTYYLYTGKRPEIKGVNFSYIKLPIRNIIALSSTHLGMMEILKITDKLVGISDDKYLCSNDIKEKQITNVGDIGTGSFEGYIAQKPDLLMHSGFDMNAPILKQLYQAKVSTFANYDWKETHPLGRAEWIKVFGVLFDKEKEAETYFNQEVMRYKTLKDLAKQALEQPKILSGSVWGDFWNAPAGESYMAQLFEDANLNYLYKNIKGVGSLELNFEAVLADHGNIENWINAPGKSLDEIKKSNPKYEYLEAFKQKKVFSYTANQNCFWEKSAVSPHKILADLITLLHPDLVDDKTTYFYARVDK